MTKQEARERWTRKILTHYNRGHYRRALKLLADNAGDRGDVVAMIRGLCENMSPADYVFEPKGGTGNDGKHSAKSGSSAGTSTAG